MSKPSDRIENPATTTVLVPKRSASLGLCGAIVIITTAIGAMR